MLEVCCGTKSISKVAEENGWFCITVDVDRKQHPDICCDILEWDYKQFPRDMFHHVHCSPPCQHYSIARTRAKTPRDFETADKLSKKCLEIIEYFTTETHFCTATLENPFTGYLKTREHMLPFAHLLRVVSYCRYGAKYRKNTAFWCFNFQWCPKICRKDCNSMIGGRHLASAQRGPCMTKIGRDQNKNELNSLYSIPPALCQELVDVISERLDS